MAARSARSLAAEARFRDLLSELGAVLLEPRWLGDHQPHRIRCAAGHLGAPRPNGVFKGQGICRDCGIAKRRRTSASLASEAQFRARLAELGATLLEPTWLGALKPHRVRCACGQLRSARPGNILNGWGFCKTCAGKDPAVSEAKFRARLEVLGATLLEPVWLGVNKPHRTRCACGRLRNSRPSAVIRGLGICITCAGQDPAVAEAKYRARLAELGATLLDQEWLGVETPRRVLCPAGHECSPRPHSVMGGQGICLKCAGQAWDVFYVVTDPSNHRLKFGITSGDPAHRLRRHRRYGYSEVVRLLTGLPADVARDIERSVLAALALAQAKPIQGREYYDTAVLDVVLDIADNYPIDTQQEVA